MAMRPTSSADEGATSSAGSLARWSGFQLQLACAHRMVAELPGKTLAIAALILMLCLILAAAVVPGGVVPTGERDRSAIPAGFVLLGSWASHSGGWQVG